MNVSHLKSNTVILLGVDTRTNMKEQNKQGVRLQYNVD